MELLARYHDGLVAVVRDVICRLDGAGDTARLVISDLATRAELDAWPAHDVFPVHARRNELRIGATGKPYGARIAIQKLADIQLAAADAAGARRRATARTAPSSSSSSASPPPPSRLGDRRLHLRRAAARRQHRPRHADRVGAAVRRHRRDPARGAADRGGRLGDLRHRSQQPRQPRHHPLRRRRDGRRGLALRSHASPSSARTSPTPSRCPAARRSTSPPCSTRPKRPTSSPASWRTSSATSPTATSWRASSPRPAPVSSSASSSAT